MSYQSSNLKKEEFRAYLEKSRVIDQLTKVLVSLYEENSKPEDPIDFIKKCLSGNSSADVERLERENQDLKAQVAALKEKLDALGAS